MPQRQPVSLAETQGIDVSVLRNVSSGKDGAENFCLQILRLHSGTYSQQIDAPQDACRNFRHTISLRRIGQFRNIKTQTKDACRVAAENLFDQVLETLELIRISFGDPQETVHFLSSARALST
jgi:hypothetical protein